MLRIKNLGEYYDFYFKIDVVFFVDVFEYFCDVILKYF